MIEVRPEELVRFTSTTNSTSSIAKVGKILSVAREHDSTTILRKCTVIDPGDRYEATDVDSLLYRSKTSPGFYELNGSIFTVPEAGSGNNDIVVTQIFYDTGVAYGDEVPDNFPESYAYLVSLYAAIKSLQRKIGGTIISITAVPPDVPSAPNITSDGVATTTVSITGTAPTYTAPTQTVSSVAWATEYPGQGSALTTGLTALKAEVDECLTIADNIHTEIGLANAETDSFPVPPDVPSLTSITYSNPGASDASLTGVASASVYTGSAPSYTKPSIEGGLTELTEVEAGTIGSAENDVEQWWNIVGQYIEDQEDSELASTQLQKIATYISAFSQEMASAINTFNASNVAYQSAIQESIAEFQSQNQINLQNASNSNNRLLQGAIQDAKVILDNNAQAIQRYQAEISEYSAEVSAASQRAQGYINTAQGYANEITSKIAIAQAYNADVAARLSLVAPKVSEFQAKMQDALNTFNDANIEYQATLQKNIQDATMAAQEAQKEGDMLLQAKIQDYTLTLQRYSAEVQEYQAEISAQVQEQTTQVTQYQLLYTQLKVDYETAFVVPGGGE